MTPRFKAVTSGVWTAVLILVLPCWLWSWSLDRYRADYRQPDSWMRDHYNAWILTAFFASLLICEYGVWRGTRGFSTGTRIFSGVAMLVLLVPLFLFLLFVASLGLNGVMP